MEVEGFIFQENKSMTTHHCQFSAALKRSTLGLSMAVTNHGKQFFKKYFIRKNFQPKLLNKQLYKTYFFGEFMKVTLISLATHKRNFS